MGQNDGSENVYNICPKIYIILSIFFCGAFLGCADENFGNESIVLSVTKSGDLTDSETYLYSDSTKNGAIELSNIRIPNPYNIDTLRKAFLLKYPNGHVTYGLSAIEPTHYQIRFLPKDSVEFKLLDDNAIITTPIPLDREVVSGGTSYFDPELDTNTNLYTWQYTIIPITATIPDIEYEILGSIRDFDSVMDGGRAYSAENDFWTELKKQAYEMCGYDASYLQEPISSRGIEGNIVFGKIEVFDINVNDYIGSKGAQVVVSGLNYIQSVYVTSWNGQYAISRTIAKDPNAKCIIKWEHDNWFIINPVNSSDNRILQAIYAIPKQPAPWNIRIKDGKQEKFASVTRAMYRIYHGNILGLAPPIKSTKMKVRCIDAYNTSSRVGSYGESGVSLWIPGINSLACFNTTIHEMGHAIDHICLRNKTGDWFSESWASLVENYITELEYQELSRYYNIVPPITNVKTITFNEGIVGPPGPPPYKVYNKPTSSNLQQWPFDFQYNLSYEPGTTALAYTPLLIDLVDADNQREYHHMYCISRGFPMGIYKEFPEDNVSGYTLPQIGLALSKLTPELSLAQLKEFREIIKTVRPNTSTQKIQIDTLINKYIYYCEKYYK